MKNLFLATLILSSLSATASSPRGAGRHVIINGIDYPVPSYRYDKPDDFKTMGPFYAAIRAMSNMNTIHIPSMYYTPTETKVITDNPDLVPILYHVKVWGDRTSKETCKVTWEYKNLKKSYANINDEETDAVRHFIGSAYLSYLIGPEKARYVLTAHEDHEKITDREAMDLFNNNLGIIFGAEFHKSLRHPEYIEQVQDEIVKGALNLLNSGQLFIFKTGPHGCARPSLYPNAKRFTISIQE